MIKSYNEKLAINCDSTLEVHGGTVEVRGNTLTKIQSNEVQIVSDSNELIRTGATLTIITGQGVDIQAEGPVSIDAQSLSSYKIFASDLINPGMGVIHCGDPDNGRGVEFEARLGQPATFFMNGQQVNIQASQTITHEAPFTGEIIEYTVGDPVFATGSVCSYDSTTKEWSRDTKSFDCICEVKPEGTVGEFVGICVALNTKSLIFATHGDYYFNVADSSKYKIGDIILLDGSVLKDDMALTGKVMKMIVGKITGKINKTTVAVLKD